jgi:ribonucleoside-diphosphate reductase alpha chain
MGAGKKRQLNLTAWVNFYQDERPAEIFVEKNGDESTAAALLDALAVAVSVGLQHGIPWRVFAGKLSGWRFPPDGVTDDADSKLRMVSSPLDYLFRWADKKINERAKRR